jgi:hypothetical protein
MFSRKQLRQTETRGMEAEPLYVHQEVKELKSLIKRFVRIAGLSDVYFPPEAAFKHHVENLEKVEKERQEMADLTVKVEKILQDKGLLPFFGQKAVFDYNEYATSSESNQPPFQHYEEIKIKTPDKTNLAAAAKAVVEWEEEYRTINNLGDSPECFKHLKEILNAV